MNPEEIVRLVLEGLTPEIGKALDAKIGELGLDKATREHNVLGGAGATLDASKMDYKAKTVALVRAIAFHDEVTAKLMSEGTDSAGGYAVPVEFHAELIRMIVNTGFLRSLVSVKPVGTDAGNYPVVSGGVSTYWTAEDAPYTESNAGLTELTYAIRKLTGLTKFTKELLADNQVNIYQELVDMFSNGMGLGEDTVIVNGNGITRPLGIMQDLGVQTHGQSGAHLAFADLLAAKYHCPKLWRESNSLVWLFNAIGAEIIEGIKDTAGRPIFRSDITGDRPQTLLGYKYYESPDMPSNQIALINLKDYYLFDRQSLAFSSTDQAETAFLNDEVWLKCSERLDGKLAHPAAHVRLTGVAV